MLSLRVPSIPEHHLLHEIRRHTTRIPHHILRDLERPRQHRIGRIHQVAKQAVPDLVARKVRCARGNSLHRATVADKTRQKIRRTCLHNEAAARKHEANLRAAVRNAYIHRQRHRDANADCRTLQRANSGLAAVENTESNAATTVDCVYQHKMMCSLGLDLYVPISVVLYSLCILAVCA
jgi:hypothetical protein